MPTAPKLVLECLPLILRPIVRLCLRHAVRAQDIIERIKIVFVRESAAQIIALRADATVSRLSAMTGLNRREVMRILKIVDTPSEPKGMLHRILGQWTGDRRFLDRRGKPRALEFEEVGTEFRDLVRLVSQDLNPLTVLFELERIGAVEKIRNRVRVKDAAYIARDDSKGTFLIMSRDVGDLIEAAATNAMEAPEPPHLHATTHYDRIVPSAVPTIKEWFLREGAALHQRARSFLGQFDRDINPSLPKESHTVRVALGTFSIVQEPQVTLPTEEEDDS